MKRSIQKLGSFPFYVFGIIVFFLSHGYSENVGLVPFFEMLFFFLGSAFVASMLLFFFKKKVGSFIKSGIMAGLILFFYLFYGAIQDGLKNSWLLFQFSRYRILLPAMLIVIATSFFFIRKSSKDFTRLTLFLNALISVLILVDLVTITNDFFSKEKISTSISVSLNKFSICDSCKKPNIYLIVMDEYWGNKSLKEYFNYSNQSLDSFLKRESFFVVKRPSSNYSSTPLSMASTFDMKYIDWLNGRKQVRAEDYGLAAKVISNSAVLNYLKFLGYNMKNLSIFDILDQPSKFNFGILPIKLKLITSKTLFGTMEKDLLWVVRVKITPHFIWLDHFFKDKFKDGNKEMMRLTTEEAGNNHSPKFVYTHLMMPHPPYLFDSLGKENASILDESVSQKQADDAYLSYLVYANHQVSELIKNIKQTSKGSSVIILMSDHGFRNYSSSNKRLSENNNFNAIYLPQKNYQLFYDSISNVNEFRVLFNTLFKQQLPLLRDSVAF